MDRGMTLSQERECARVRSWGLVKKRVRAGRQIGAGEAANRWRRRGFIVLPSMCSSGRNRSQTLSNTDNMVQDYRDETIVSMPICSELSPELSAGPGL
jgi:hypothetical protein